MSQTRFTLKDLFYFVTVLCILAAVCQAEGGAILAVLAGLVSCVVIFWLRFVDTRQILEDLAQNLRELKRRIFAIRLGTRDLVYYFVLVLVLAVVSIVEQGFVIVSFAVATSFVSIYGLRTMKHH